MTGDPRSRETRREEVCGMSSSAGKMSSGAGGMSSGAGEVSHGRGGMNSGLGTARPLTGAEYLDSLRDGREIWVYGERAGTSPPTRPSGTRPG